MDGECCYSEVALMFLFQREGSMGSDIATLLQNPKYRGIDTGLVLRAIQDRIEDYFQWCTRYECPSPDLDEEEATYEYFKGYGRALELARDILVVVHAVFTEPRKQIYG